ncbi:MAG: hypothetical protein JZD40_00310 [Sulfolobus sp.]|nr:hypothetical protein [Sulfolobus sp.]
MYLIYYYKDKSRIINDLSVCLGKVREFTSNLSEFKEINEKLISIDLYTSLNDKLVISSNTLSEFLNRLNSALHNVRVALLELFQQLSLSSLGVELNVIETVETIFSKEEPYCAKVEELYSYKDPLLAAIQISEKKDALISLKQLIEDLDLINKLKENTCVDLKEFGIDPEFYAYVKDLVSKSISVELFENGSLCITSRA